MESEAQITVQLCYVAPQLQFLRPVQVAPGATIRQAIHLSGLLEMVPELDLTQLKVGIYSKLKNLDTVLTERDRIEVYRPLLVDPMVARRTRANKK